MASSFPVTAIDSLQVPSASTVIAGHGALHGDVSDAISGIETKLGIDSSAVTTSHDYKLSGVTGTDKAVSKTGTETLTNKTLTSPTLTTPSLGVATATSINALELKEISADKNVFVGKDSGLNVPSGAANNTFLGYGAGAGGVVTNAADDNVAIGLNSLYAHTTANRNVAVGVETLRSKTSGTDNTAVGMQSLYSNTTGFRNTAYGQSALLSNVTGSNNVALGYKAGYYETGSNAFYVDNQNRTDTAGDKAKALLYGTFDAAAANQTLVVNGVLSTSVTGNSAGNVLTTNGTQTLTNKRVTKLVVTTTDDATAAINVDVTDVYELSAVANATVFTLTGTPTDGQTLIVRFKDAGVGKALTWTGFTAIGVTLPTTTVASKWHYVECVYNLAATQWQAIAVVQEA